MYCVRDTALNKTGFAFGKIHVGERGISTNNHTQGGFVGSARRGQSQGKFSDFFGSLSGVEKG